MTQNHRTVELPSSLRLVGLDASNVVDIGVVDGLHQFDKGRLEDTTERGLPVHCYPAARRHGGSWLRRLGGCSLLVSDLRSDGEDLDQKLVARCLEDLHVLVGDSVPVLFYEAVRLVRDIDSIMAYGKGRLAKTRLLVKLVLVT